MNIAAIPLAFCLSVLAGAAVAQAPVLKSGLDRAGFDTGVRAQDDLFRAANGQWLKDTPIPADKSAWGSTLQLRERADERVKAIVEALAAAKSAPGSNEAKIGDWYRSQLDVDAIDKAGTAPLKPWLDELDAVKDKRGLATLLGRWQGVVPNPLGTYVLGDVKDPGTYRLVLWQGDLSLPDRAYYLDDNERFLRARAAWHAYARTLLQLQGDADADANAKRVLGYEALLAQAQWSRVDNRDPVKIYNPRSVGQLREMAPGFDWAAFLEAAELRNIDRLSVSQPSYFTAFAKLVDEAPLDDWKLYLRVRLLARTAQVLPQAYRNAHFALNGKALQGSEQERPRWQVAIGSVNAALGEAVGQAYVARHFPPAYKARMNELVDNLLAAYGKSIDDLTWMSPETRVRAKEKLAKYSRKIGYPDRWRDYSGLEVKAGDALGNEMRAGRFEHLRQARRIGRPVDRGEWSTTPQTVNAFYSPRLNAIIFPAAILEPPLFDMSADDAANYGAIGAIIGHEISHGFDDQGSQYDGDGVLSNWWTAADRKAFESLGDRLAAQYGAYEPLAGHKLNGRLTLGENIADLSGLQIAHKAYRLSLKGQEAPVIDGLSGDRRFFLAWGQAWRSKLRDARILQLVTSDTHALPEYRANGAAVNHDGFHEAFGTKPGDGMFKSSDSRIRIW